MHDLKSHMLLLVTLLLSAATIGAEERYPVPSGPGEPPAIWNGVELHPYSSPFALHVGRYLDSAFTLDLIDPLPRTLRAGKMSVVPENGRVYVHMGEKLVSYDLSTFFTSDLGSPLISDETVAHLGETPYIEHYLPWESSLDPETDDWVTYAWDGQKRLFDHDWDDRGYVYVAYSIWGFGIVDGQTLATVSQVDWTETENNPYTIASFREADKYYVVSGGMNTEIWDVTDPTDPVFVTMMADRHSDVAVAHLSSGDVIALLLSRYDPDLNRTVREISLYRASDLLAEGKPFQTIAQTTGYTFAGIEEGGGNFYALERSMVEPSFTLHTLTLSDPLGPTFDHVEHPMTGMMPQGLRYGDGHLTVWGSNHIHATDIWLYRLVNDIPVGRDLGNFTSNHYTPQEPPDGVDGMAQGYTSDIRDALYIRHERKAYLAVSTPGLGDVYELEPFLLAADANGNETAEVADVFYLINHLFAGGPPPAPIFDPNGDGAVTVADVFYLINHLFSGGPAPL
ncbi:MAG: hypothetical protein KY432_03015 [Acidobacteria bacterium]|nr:hypothetical protein [Acidobacteriota bacterium]